MLIKIVLKALPLLFVCISAIIAIGGDTWNKKRKKWWKRVTRRGWIAIACALLTLSVGITNEIYTAHFESLEYQNAKREKRELKDKIENLVAGNDKILELVSLLSQPESSLRLKRIEELTTDPTVKEFASAHQDFQQVLDQIASRIGGKPQVLRRLNAIHPSRSFTPNSVAVLASFSLRWYSYKSKPQTHAWIIQIIRGMEADVIALQELLDEMTFERLLHDLPEFYGIISTSGKPTHHALLLRRERVTPVGQKIEIDGNSLRCPMVQKMKIGNIEFWLTAVHFPWTDRQAREQEVQYLANWIQEQSSDVSIIVAGVFQSQPDSSIFEPLRHLNVRFVTTDLPDNVGTVDSQLTNLSQFAFFGPVRDKYVEKSSHVYDLVKLIPEMTRQEIRKSISDHNPISVVINLE